jgi:hypothetical protein
MLAYALWAGTLVLDNAPALWALLLEYKDGNATQACTLALLVQKYKNRRYLSTTNTNTDAAYHNATQACNLALLVQKYCTKIDATLVQQIQVLTQHITMLHKY